MFFFLQTKVLTDTKTLSQWLAAQTETYQFHCFATRVAAVYGKKSIIFLEKVLLLLFGHFLSAVWRFVLKLQLNFKFSFYISPTLFFKFIPLF